MVRKTASGAGVVVMRRNCSKTETRGVEVGYANARGWGCGSGSDAEDRRNETKRSLEGVLPREGHEESDIVDAKGREMCSMD